MYVNEAECIAAGLDPTEVKKIAAGISRYAKQADKLGILIFGGSDGELRYRDDDCKGELKLASLDGRYSGGCGADHDWGDGLIRGE